MQRAERAAQAVQAVHSGRPSFRAAATTFGISVCSLQKRMSGGVGIAARVVLTVENEDSVEDTFKFAKIQVLLIVHNFTKYSSFPIPFSAACAQEHGALFKLLHVPRTSKYVISQHCE